MRSAFGVNHGEISKGYRLVKVPRGLKAPGGKRMSQSQVRTSARSGAPSGAQRVKGALKSASEAQVSVKGIGESFTGGVRRGSQFTEKHPALTGAALVGGGGTAGYKYLKKDPKRS